MLKKANQIIRGRRTVSFIIITRILLSLLIFVILAAFFIGVLKIISDLVSSIQENVEVFIRQIIVDSVILLALIEVLRIATSYLQEG